MARTNRKNPKKTAASHVVAGATHSHGEEAIARLIRLARHPSEAVSTAASLELLEMLCGRPLRVAATASASKAD